MSVLRTEKLTTTLKGSGDGGYIRTNRYRVVCTDRVTDPATIWTTATIPAPGTPWTWDGGGVDYWCFADGTPDVQLEHGTPGTEARYIVTVQFKTPNLFSDRDNQDLFSDPLAEPWEFSRDSDEWTEEAIEDENGDPIQNSAHDTVKGKAVERFRCRARLTLAKNLATYNGSLVDAYEGAVNSADVMICGKDYPERTLYLRRIRVQRRAYGAGLFYFPHTFELAYNEETWDLRFMDEGWHEFVGNAGEENDPTKKQFVLDPVHKQPLWIRLKDGRRLPNGEQPVVLKKKVYKKRDFNALNFPNSPQGA